MQQIMLKMQELWIYLGLFRIFRFVYMVELQSEFSKETLCDNVLQDIN